MPATSVDDFVIKHGIDTVHWLAVDTEGFDALVLEGAQYMFNAHRIHIVEFEYNTVGYWHPRFEDKRELMKTLEGMRNAGYGALDSRCTVLRPSICLLHPMPRAECFWQGNDGRLARAGSPVWCGVVKVRWSNLVCSCVPAIVAVLGALS